MKITGRLVPASNGGSARYPFYGSCATFFPDDAWNGLQPFLHSIGPPGMGRHVAETESLCDGKGAQAAGGNLGLLLRDSLSIRP
jgi:hypothetical protein